MQVKIKFGKEWWLMPIKGEFTKKELERYSHVPYIAPLEVGEQVKFFNIKQKQLVKHWLGVIEQAYLAGYKPVLTKIGAVTFRKIKREPTSPKIS